LAEGGGERAPSGKKPQAPAGEKPGKQKGGPGAGLKPEGSVAQREMGRVDRRPRGPGLVAPVG